MVNDNMVETALSNTEGVVYNCGHPNITDVKEYAQAVVNAAWTKFDPDDESTWPECGKGRNCRLTPNGDAWMVLGVDVRSPFLQMAWNGPDNWRSLDITHYADPQNLMFKEET